MLYLMNNRRSQLVSMLALSCFTWMVFASSAFAQAPKPRCKVAKEVSPVADMLAGESLGLAYALGIPIAVALLAFGVILAMTKKGMGFLKAFFTVAGLIIFLGAIVGALAAVANNPC